MKVHVFMHVPYEGLGHIEDWAEARHYDFSFTQWYLEEHPPALEEIDMLIVLGGPMGVHDVEEYPWLMEEKAYLRKAIDQKKPILGICLGAQILAELLGGEVRVNPHREIGWHPITLEKDFLKTPLAKAFPEEQPIVFQWHHDGFSLPKGAMPIGSSPVSACQGYVYDEHIVGIQFHLEMNRDFIHRLINKARHELDNTQPYVMSEEEIEDRLHISDSMQQQLYTLMDSWVEMLRLT